MSLEQFVEGVKIFGQAAVAIGAALGLGFALGKYNRRLESFGKKLAAKRGATRETLSQSVPAVEEVKQRSVKEAICYGPNTKSIVKGVVDFWTPAASEGYVAVIRDSSGQVPFYVSDDNISPYDGKWVVPVLLEHSRRNDKQITMEVDSPDGLPILVVTGVRGYEIDGQRYDV